MCLQYNCLYQHPINKNSEHAVQTILEFHSDKVKGGLWFEFRGSTCSIYKFTTKCLSRYCNTKYRFLRCFIGVNFNMRMSIVLWFTIKCQTRFSLGFLQPIKMFRMGQMRHNVIIYPYGRDIFTAMRLLKCNRKGERSFINTICSNIIYLDIRWNLGLLPIRYSFIMKKTDPKKLKSVKI